MTREQLFVKRVLAYRESHFGVSHIVLHEAPQFERYTKGEEPWLIPDSEVPGLYLLSEYGRAVMGAYAPRAVGRPMLSAEQRKARDAAQQKAKADKERAKIIEAAKVGVALYGGSWLTELLSDIRKLYEYHDGAA